MIIGYIGESKIECLIDIGSQLSSIPFSYVNNIVNIKMVQKKSSPWLKIRVANCANLMDSDEGKI